MDRSRISLSVLLVAVLAMALVAVPAIGQRSEGGLRDKIGSQRDRERSLAAGVARLARLERATAREVAILERRVAAVRAELAAAETVLASTVQRRNRQRERALRLRARLKASRAQLAELLRQRYAGGEPDIVTVVLRADGFAQLLETMEFLERLQRQNEQILDAVKTGRRDALAQRRTLTRLSEQRRVAADAVRKRHAALAAIAAGLGERRAALAQARTARAALLRGTRASRRRAERSLERLLARRARALRAAGLGERRAALAQARTARAALLRGTRASRRRAERSLNRLLAQRARALRAAGPGGPWSIPWPVVQCESGGQNLPPNSAGASGFYQFMPATWRGLGGSTPHAYLAPKAEQDRLAARLWAGGDGAHNWVCAALVGSL